MIDKRDLLVSDVVNYLPRVQHTTHSAVENRKVVNNAYVTLFDGIKSLSKSAILSNTVVVQLADRKYEAAVVNAVRAIDLMEPNDPCAHIYYLNAGLCYYYSLKFEEARKYFTKVIEKNPTDKLLGNAYFLRSMCNGFLRNEEQRASDACEALQLNPSLNVTFHYKLLPLEIMHEVFKFLEASDSYKVMQTCKEFKGIAMNPASGIAYSNNKHFDWEKHGPLVEHLIVKRDIRVTWGSLTNIKKITLIDSYRSDPLNISLPVCVKSVNLTVEGSAPELSINCPVRELNLLKVETFKEYLEIYVSIKAPKVERILVRAEAAPIVVALAEVWHPEAETIIV